jgi:rare lipoprotein A
VFLNRAKSGLPQTSRLGRSQHSGWIKFREVRFGRQKISDDHHKTILWRSVSMIAALVLVGCSSSPPSRYGLSQDTGPDRTVDVSKIPEPVPRQEPLSRGGNKPYTVFGKKYYPLTTAAGFTEEGTASWYGRKFHGHRTSNGEVYDMYRFSAAHKTLPLPSYVRVTNLRNQHSIVVRVNDRGPFHSNRIIDLSYAAAKKLGYSGQGTAPVRVEAIDLSQAPVAGRYLQLEAFKSEFNAQQFLAKAKQILGAFPVFIQRQNTDMGPVHRVRVGPLDPETLQQALAKLDQAEFKQPLVLPHNDA